MYLQVVSFKKYKQSLYSLVFNDLITSQNNYSLNYVFFVLGCIAVSYNTHDKSCALKDNSNGGEQFLSGYQSVLMSCEADIEEDEASIMPEVEDEASIMPEVEETHLRLIKPSEPSVHEIDDKCRLKNTDFPGPTLIKYKVGSAGKCLEKCRRFGNQCVAFTFMAEYKTCLGKGADHGAATMTSWRARNGAVAGT